MYCVSEIFDLNICILFAAEETIVHLNVKWTQMAQAEENSHPALIDAASKIYCDESIHNIWRTFYEVTGALLMG